MSIYLGAEKISNTKTGSMGTGNTVSYDPQSPTPSEQAQARTNLGIKPGLGVTGASIGDLIVVESTTGNGVPDKFKKITTEEVTGDKADTAYVRTFANNFYHERVLEAKDVDEVNQLFVDWWNLQWFEGATKQSMVEEWFSKVLYDNRVHGVKFPLFATSSSPSGELTDDSVGLVAEPSTEMNAGRDDFAKLPQFWTLEVAAVKNTDGTHEIVAVEHIDPISEVRNSKNKALTWVLQKNTYRGEGTQDGYYWLKTRCTPFEGYTTWNGGTSKNGRIYSYMGYPKYGAGLYEDGTIGCATGLKPAIYLSQASSVNKWRERGTQYAGASANLLKWQTDMVRLKYARKGNSGLIEGCTYYWEQIPAAVSETNAQRIIVSTTNAKKLLVGSSVAIGEGDNQWAGTFNKTVRIAKITSIAPISVEGVSYSAVNLDVKTGFDTVAGTTKAFTQPYYTGYNDGVLGYDGSRTNPTGGKEPGLIQRTEFLNGAYFITADELWKYSKDTSGNYLLEVYVCKDSSKITTNGTITADYEKIESLTLTFPPEQAAEWQYIEDLAVSEGGRVCWPSKISKSAGTGTGVMDGFYIQPGENAVRAGWRCYYLSNGGTAGLACVDSFHSVGGAVWYAAPGSSGLAG